MTKTKLLVPLVLQKLQENEELSVISVCEEVGNAHDIAPETLKKAYYRYLHKNQNKTHANQKFTDATEIALCAIIIAFSSSGCALTPTMFLEFVKRSFKTSCSWSWFQSFLTRHSNVIKYKKGATLEASRITSVDQSCLEGFCKTYSRHLSEYNYNAEFIINADESSCDFTTEEVKHLLVGASSSRQARVNLPKTLLRTILPFVSASGESLDDCTYLQVS
jgi:hypothetical protein